jgi:hypothetical protein
MMLARAGLCTVATVLLSGCPSVIQHPPQGRLSSVEEVFDKVNPGAEADQAPAGSKRSNTFAASYQEVFRAVVVGASQNQINIESENRARGLVLGTRAIQTIPPVPRCPNSEQLNGRALPLKYFYVISVREKGPKTTEVVAALKAQGTCWSACLESVDLHQCKAYSVPHWATPPENPDETLTQLMVFIRNNLIAAGAL